MVRVVVCVVEEARVVLPSTMSWTEVEFNRLPRTPITFHVTDSSPGVAVWKVKLVWLPRCRSNHA